MLEKIVKFGLWFVIGGLSYVSLHRGRLIDPLPEFPQE